jgi:putative DNA primase/helicase
MERQAPRSAASNELPRLGDASSAIIGRLVLLLTTRSWLGKENYDLEPALHAELTGILNWSLDGLRRLTLDNENHFTRFEAAEEAITAMRDLASPVGAFVRERCKLDSHAEIAVDDLYNAYKDWCQVGEYPKSPKAHFGRDLRAACPSVRKRRPRGASDISSTPASGCAGTRRSFHCDYSRQYVSPAASWVSPRAAMRLR